MFTDPVITILFVIFPSTLSFAVAPASVYVSPTERVIDAWPFNAIAGGVVSVSVLVPVVEVVVPLLPPPPVGVAVPVVKVEAVEDAIIVITPESVSVLVPLYALTL